MATVSVHNSQDIKQVDFRAYNVNVKMTRFSVAGFFQIDLYFCTCSCLQSLHCVCNIMIICWFIQTLCILCSPLVTQL